MSASSYLKFKFIEIKSHRVSRMNSTSFPAGLVVILFLVVMVVDGYKILGVFPTSSKSHYIVGGALMRGLAAAGHEVTVISPYPRTEPLKNFRDIPILGIDKLIEKKLISNMLDMDDMSLYNKFRIVFEYGITTTNYTMNHEVMHTFLSSPKEQFDLIVLEVFMNDAMLGLGHHFKAPVIGFATFGASKWSTDLVGTPSPLSYVPNTFLSFTDRMTFFQRVGNVLLTFIVDYLYTDFIFMRKQKQIYKDTFADPKPTLEVLRKNVSLVLLNSHFSLSYPRPYVPNMIEVGGIQVNRAQNNLTGELRKFVDSAEHGVIYFSMGTFIKSSDLPVETRKALVRVFSKLRQNVLWKWEDSELTNMPSNVFISNWFPQEDVLAHPNVKLFITHGGLLGSTEAIFHGVPVLGIPIFGDQHLNMARAVSAGYGLSIAFSNLTEKSLTWAINEILSYPKYADMAKVMSKRYRDQPMTPMETAIYWIEYVARHKGAPHLRSSGQDLQLIAYHCIDVFVFIIVLIASVLLAVLYTGKYLMKLAFNKEYKKKKNN